MKKFKELYEIDAAYSSLKDELLSSMEKDKLDYTLIAQTAIEREKFDIAVELLQKLAKICRFYGNEGDARKVEHRIFLCEQMMIFQKAQIPLDDFSRIPYAEILKRTLTRLAKDAECGDMYAYYVGLNIRICKAQGETGSVAQMTCPSARRGGRYDNGIEDPALPIPAEDESKLRHVAEEYEYDYHLNETSGLKI